MLPPEAQRSAMAENAVPEDEGVEILDLPEALSDVEPSIGAEFEPAWRAAAETPVEPDLVPEVERSIIPQVPQTLGQSPMERLVPDEVDVPFEPPTLGDRKGTLLAGAGPEAIPEIQAEGRAPSRPAARAEAPEDKTGVTSPTSASAPFRAALEARSGHKVSTHAAKPAKAKKSGPQQRLKDMLGFGDDPIVPPEASELAELPAPSSPLLAPTESGGDHALPSAHVLPTPEPAARGDDDMPHFVPRDPYPADVAATAGPVSEPEPEPPAPEPDALPDFLAREFPRRAPGAPTRLEPAPPAPSDPTPEPSWTPEPPRAAPNDAPQPASHEHAAPRRAAEGPADPVADEFMRTSAVMRAQARPVRREPRPQPTPIVSAAGAAILALAGDVGRLGVPEGQRAGARAALIDLAGQLDSSTLTWASLRAAVAFLMAHPEMARQLMPLLVPYLDKAK
jgi:hypothetical protein